MKPVDADIFKSKTGKGMCGPQFQVSKNLTPLARSETGKKLVTLCYIM